MNAKQNHRSLDWISQGLDEAIIGARQSLESYLSGSSEPEKLIECRRHLEVIHASFDEVDFPFATLLSEQLILLIDVIIKDDCVSDDNAYQALLGGLLQLPNYLVRLRSIQNNKASDIIAVVNDVRAAANVPLIVDQNIFSLTDDVNENNYCIEDDSARSRVHDCQAILAVINKQADNDRSALNNLQAAFSELMACIAKTEASSEQSINGLVVDAIEVLIVAAAKGSSQLSLAAKYSLHGGLSWLDQCFNSESVSEIDSKLTHQVLRELLFCIALYDSDFDKVQAFKKRYRLLDALNIHHPSEVLRLGTPDAETMEIVFDSLLSDFVLLKNALECSADSDNGALLSDDSSSDGVTFEKMASMASTLRYTLQLAQYDSLAEQLITVEKSLTSLHSDKQLIADDERKSEVIKNIAEDLYKVESRLHQNHLGVARNDSEISVINEVIHCVSTMAENLSARQSSLHDFFDDAQFLNYEPFGDLTGQLIEAEGAMKIIGVDNLVESMSGCAAYLQENIINLKDDQAVNPLIHALKLMESYLEALKYNQHEKLSDALSIVVNGLAANPEAIAVPEEIQVPEEMPAPEELSVPEELPVHEEKSVLAVSQEALEGDFDIDIVEIFIEEAEEVITSFRESIALWSNDFNNSECMADIRRGFHTLKGSGRMAGAEHIGDAAWSIEALINRMTDGSVPIDAIRMTMVGEAIEYMPYLIESFKQRVIPLSSPLTLFIERANKLAAQADYVDTSLEIKDSVIEASIQTDIEATPADKEISEQSSEERIKEDIKEDVKKGIEEDVKDGIEEGVKESIEGSIEGGLNENTNDADEKSIQEESVNQESEEADSDSVSSDDMTPATFDDQRDKRTRSGEIANDILDDSTLQTIFVSELEIQLSVVNGYLESHLMDNDIYPSEAVERALHTIVGGARIANNPLISDLFAPAEILLCLIKKRCAISDSENNLLTKLHDWTLSQIHLGEFIKPNSVDENSASLLIDELNQAVADDLDSSDQDEAMLVENDLIFKASYFLQEWRATGSRPDTYESMLSVLKQIEQAATDGDQSFIQQQCHCLNNLYEHFSGGGLHYQAYIVLLNGHRDLEDMLDRIAAGQRVEVSLSSGLENLLANEKNLLVQIKDNAIEDTISNEDAQEDDFNQEIVSIFLDESEDLIETLEADVQQWLNNRSDISYLKTLMRPLHTIKGGARMAGLDRVGNVSHEFETLLLSVSNGDNKTNGQFFKQVSQFVSDLTESVSAVRSKLLIDVAGSNTQPSNDNSQPEEKRSDEMIRVPSVLLEKLVNLAGETSISRSLIEEQVTDFAQSTDEIDSTIQRLKEQLRRLEIEMEAQIEFRKEQVESEGNEEFDPLEMDRYSQVQQLSKSLVESASDLKDLKSTLVEKTRDIETSLVQQARINTQLQEGLMQTRTVPLARHIVPRLRRIVRQVSGELDKPITFKVNNAGGELDRSMLERMVTPLEHVLRNAIDHGIETSEERTKLGKPEQGVISLNIRREGGDVVLELSDDGRGLDVTAIREKALARGLIEKDSELSDEEVMRFIFAAGFSTAKSLTQLSGRGVGMDVVQSEIADLGGSVELHSKHNQGTLFTFRVPFTVSMNRALLVSAGGEQLAVPLDSIEGIVRVSPFELEQYYGEDATEFLYAGQQYDFSYLGHLINGSSYHSNPEMVSALPVLLVRGGDKFYALQVDRLIASREIVVKSLGAQFANLEGIAGATVLGDGSVVMIADLAALIRSENSVATHSNVVSLEKARDHLVAMVVDDSVTVRKVTSRLLERRGMDVVTAKDGLDAMLQLEDVKPDFILLDIEMPRMDGFEVVTRIRNDVDLAHIPIIMITSRTGDKHRERALGLGANAFLGKPYQEAILFDAISNVLPANGLDEQFGT